MEDKKDLEIFRKEWEEEICNRVDADDKMLEGPSHLQRTISRSTSKANANSRKAKDSSHQGHSRVESRGGHGSDDSESNRCDRTSKLSLWSKELRARKDDEHDEDNRIKPFLIADELLQGKDAIACVKDSSRQRTTETDEYEFTFNQNKRLKLCSETSAGSLQSSQESSFLDLFLEDLVCK